MSDPVIRTLAKVSIVTSLIAIFAAFLYIPYLIGRIGNISNELEMDMDEFKILEQNLWKDLMSAKDPSGAGVTANPMAMVRSKRQAPECRKLILWRILKLFKAIDFRMLKRESLSCWSPGSPGR